MPDIEGDIDFLEDLPLYHDEKPYFYVPGRNEDLDPEDKRLSNLKFKTYNHLRIRDMRQNSQLRLAECGFEFVRYQKSVVQAFLSECDIDTYKAEISAMLRARFSAATVYTYELKLRKNVQFHRKEFDLNDKLLVEGPAKGAHNDVTPESFQKIVERSLLENEEMSKFLTADYRFRIVNTWRPMNDMLEDRPLALCDARSVAADDLIATDRILPDRDAEIYYLRHNPQQQWYWLEKQKTTEPFIFLMYDTMCEAHSARFCPHVSFDNSRASPGAVPRSSVETRSIVVTKATQNLRTL